MEETLDNRLHRPKMRFPYRAFIDARKRTQGWLNKWRSFNSSIRSTRGTPRDPLRPALWRCRRYAAKLSSAWMGRPPCVICGRHTVNAHGVDIEYEDGTKVLLSRDDIKAQTEVVLQVLQSANQLATSWTALQVRPGWDVEDGFLGTGAAACGMGFWSVSMTRRSMTADSKEVLVYCNLL